MKDIDSATKPDANVENTSVCVKEADVALGYYGFSNQIISISSFLSTGIKISSYQSDVGPVLAYSRSSRGRVGRNLHLLYFILESPFYLSHFTFEIPQILNLWYAQMLSINAGCVLVEH